VPTPYSIAVQKLSVCVLTTLSEIITAARRDLKACTHRPTDELITDYKLDQLVYVRPRPQVPVPHAQPPSCARNLETPTIYPFSFGLLSFTVTQPRLPWILNAHITPSLRPWDGWTIGHPVLSMAILK